MALVEEGRHVIFKADDGQFKIVKIDRKTKHRIGKMNVRVGGAIGSPLFSRFTAQKGELVRVEHTHAHETVEEITKTVASGEDNRDLTDDASHQKLSTDEIVAMKASGTSGKELIHKLVESSATFQKKNQFSQEKYIRKKAKNHGQVVQVLPVSADVVCKIFYEKTPVKINHIRQDTLASLLLHANLRPNAKVMVVESAAGMVAAAILSRLAGHGTLVQLHPGNQCPNALFDPFDFDQAVRDTHFTYSMGHVAQLFEARSENRLENSPLREHKVKLERHLADASDEKFRAETAKKLKRVDDKQLRAEQLMFEANFDSLVLACKFDPLQMLETLLKFMAPSRPFVVFCTHREPLVECMNKLKGRYAVNLQLFELWSREYQVLPQRTHPTMMMDACGGFMLRGTTIASVDTASLKVAPADEEPGQSSSVAAAAASAADEADAEVPAPKRAKDDDE